MLSPGYRRSSEPSAPTRRRRACSITPTPHSASAASPSSRSGRAAPGVRLKRGAAAGCRTPPSFHC